LKIIVNSGLNKVINILILKKLQLLTIIILLKKC